MPAFWTHFRKTVPVAVVAALVTATITVVGAPTLSQTLLVAGVTFLITLLSGVAPDVDASQASAHFKHASKPYRGLIGLLAAALAISPLVAADAFVRHSPHVGDDAGLVMSIVGVYLVLKYVVPSLADIVHRYMPKHRGVFHQVRVWAALCLVVAVALHWGLSREGAPLYLTHYLPVGVVIGVTLGTSTHISYDIVTTLVRKHIPKYIRILIRRLPIRDLFTLARILVSPKTPHSIRVLVPVTVVVSFIYALWPLEVLPDIILGFGWLDDYSLYAFLREVVFTGYDHNLDVEDATHYLFTVKLVKFFGFIIACLVGGFVLITYVL